VQSRPRLGVEAVFTGVASGYRLEETAGVEAAEKATTGAEAAVGVKHRGAAGRGVVSAGGGGLEHLLEEVRREFSGLPVYVGVEDGYVKRTAPMDQRQFKKYLETYKRLSFRFDRRGERWVKPLEELKAA
jgi:hypothetical protein